MTRIRADRLLTSVLAAGIALAACANGADELPAGVSTTAAARRLLSKASCARDA